MGRPDRKAPEPQEGIPDTPDMGKGAGRFKGFVRHGRAKKGWGKSGNPPARVNPAHAATRAAHVPLRGDHGKWRRRSFHGSSRGAMPRVRVTVRVRPRGIRLVRRPRGNLCSGRPRSGRCSVPARSPSPSVLSHLDLSRHRRERYIDRRERSLGDRLFHQSCGQVCGSMPSQLRQSRGFPGFPNDCTKFGHKLLSCFYWIFVGPNVTPLKITDFETGPVNLPLTAWTNPPADARFPRRPMLHLRICPAFRRGSEPGERVDR